MVTPFQRTTEEETKPLSPDRGFSFYPPLFSEAESIAARSRAEVSMSELLKLNLSLADS